MKWRVVRQESHNASTNMAIDDVLSVFVSKEKSPPTIRFYRYDPPAVTIGCFQNIHDEVNVSECNKKGIDCVRRFAGGAMNYHADEIAYSIIAPGYMFPKYVEETLPIVCEWVVKGLGKIGIKAGISSLDTVQSEGKRIAWNSQTLRNDAIVHQGSVFYSTEQFAKIAKKNKDITSVKEISNASFEDAAKALEESFIEKKDWKYGSLSRDELQETRYLAEKYSDRNWTFIK